MDARERAWYLRRPVRRALLPIDVVIVAWYSVLTIIVLASWARIQHPMAYLAVHACLIGGLLALAWADGRYRSRVVRFAHYWIPAVMILASFRELHYLVPEVHPFADRRFDWALNALDRRWFGDVAGFWRNFDWPLLADAMQFCYWMYFPMPLILCATLWKRGELARFRDSAAVMFLGWYVSYLGYVAVPAVGPHHVIDGPRAPHLDGVLWGSFFHKLLLDLEWEMPDAFPSGHALVGMLVPILAWRHDRRVFWALLPFAVGCVVATMYLRYHYVVDIVGSVAIVPVAVVGGRALVRWMELSRESGSLPATAEPLRS